MANVKPTKLPRLADLRKERKVSKTEIATFCGYSHSAVVKWENGQCEPSIEALIKLAEFFGVSIDYLVGRIEPPPLTESQKKLINKIQTLSEEQVNLLLLFTEQLK